MKKLSSNSRISGNKARTVSHASGARAVIGHGIGVSFASGRVLSDASPCGDGASAAPGQGAASKGSSTAPSSSPRVTEWNGSDLHRSLLDVSHERRRGWGRIRGAKVKSEKEKMLSGELYDPLDPQLSDERRQARLLIEELNVTKDDQTDERNRLLGQLLPHAGTGLWIQPPFFCDYGSNITLGDSVFFNFSCIVLDVAPVRIGSRVLFGPAVQIYAATHPLRAADRRTGLEAGKAVEIGDDVWVGGGAVICPGVRIGSRTVIGAGSVVTKDVPDDVFAAGNPCRVVKKIDL
ncbi:sugar O-acetyltransferase [Aromatoleum sp.]|uniref:sugar O-acetyltransferase n=1 Tax=Aromatoleum sp. TaxID=2307007 RepID=UPI002FC9DDC3